MCEFYIPASHVREAFERLSQILADGVPEPLRTALTQDLETVKAECLRNEIYMDN